MLAARSLNAGHQIAEDDGKQNTAALPSPEAGVPAATRFADETIVPTPSPVHRLQAELAQITAPERTVSAEAADEALYPGWFRVFFPVATSASLWAAILWGVGQLA